MFLGSTSSRSAAESCWRRQRLRSAIAPARLASSWPTMKRSSSETISRGLNEDVMSSFRHCERSDAISPKCVLPFGVVLADDKAVELGDDLARAERGRHVII